MHMDFVSYSVQFIRKVFEGGLYEKKVRQTAFRRFSIDLFRYLFQGSSVRVDPDVKPGRVPASRLVHKVTVAGPDIYYYPLAGREQ